MRTTSTYASAKKRYLAFSETYRLSPVPLTENVLCLFAAFLALQGLRPQSIGVYLAGVGHLEIANGGGPAQRDKWPRLQYLLKGIARSEASARPFGRLCTAFMRRGHLMIIRRASCGLRSASVSSVL